MRTAHTHEQGLAQSPRGYSEQGGIPARMLNSVHDFPVYIVNYYIQYKVLVNQDKEFSWGPERDDVSCRTGRQNEQYHRRTAHCWNPEDLTFPTRGGSIFADENCARRSLYNPNIQYPTEFTECPIESQDSTEIMVVLGWM